jgi:cytochrome c
MTLPPRVLRARLRVNTSRTWWLICLLPAAVFLASLVGCDRRNRIREAALLTGGNPERGRHVIRTYGCGSCHTIPGVRGANSLVGPPLAGVAQRAYIAGVLPNTPTNLVAWIERPQNIDPQTAMPNLGVSARDARDIAGYLYSLK